MSQPPTPAAFNGVQYWGEGSIFDGTASNGVLVTDGDPADRTYVGTSGDDIISGGRGNDSINGWSGNDILYGGKGDDVVNGGSGSDTVIVSSGNDSYNGGSGGNGKDGIDVLDYSLMKGNLDLNFGKHTAVVGSGNHLNLDTISSFEVVVGTTSGTDTIRGDHNDNMFVSAGANNTFRGGLGNDVLVGGSGADTYVITKKDIADGSVKTFENFTAGQDTVDMGDFLKGHPDTASQVQFKDVVNPDGTHSTLVESLVHSQLVGVVELTGVNMNDIGADHHHMTFADLHAQSLGAILS